jgi:hypothetical protein
VAKKLTKLKKLVSGSLIRQLAQASPDDLETLRVEVERARQKRLRKMEKKGYRLEAVVADVYGVFTRAAAIGTLRPVETVAEERRASIG